MTRLSDEFPDSYSPISFLYRQAVVGGDAVRAAALTDQFLRRPRPLPTPFDTEVNWVLGTANGFGRNGLFRDAGGEIQAGRPAVAEQLLRDALAAAWQPEVADKFAEVQFVRGKPHEAAKLLSEAVERDGPTFELLWRLGQVHQALGEPDRAAAMWERAIPLATGPQAQGLWQDLSEINTRLGQKERARLFTARAQLAEGMSALDQGRPVDAVTVLARAVESDPNLALGWYYLGQAHRLQGNMGEARSATERCLALDPNHGRAIRLARLLTPDR
jgi:predicted Zn-dependent protease